MSPYEILGIDSSATKVEIKKAFAKLVKENPPEKDPVKYQKIRTAYEKALENLSKNSETVRPVFVNPDEIGNESAFKNQDDSDETVFGSVLDTIQKSAGQSELQQVDAKKIDSIKKNLFSQNTFKVNDLLKKYCLRGIALSDDERKIAKEKSKMERKYDDSGKSTIRTIRFVVKLVVLFWFLISALSRC